MNSITINIDPILLQLGPFALRWYSLAIALGVVVATFVAAREARRKGLPEDEVYSIAFWSVLVGILGSRLFHILDKWEYYLNNPIAILALQQGGLAIWGGVLVGVLTGFLYAQRRRLPLGAFADVAAPAILSGQIIGRIGCLINGDAYGGVTDLPWGFVYAHPNALIPNTLKGVPTHPYPLYEMIYNLLLLALLFRVRKGLRPDGMLLFLYLGLYSLGRFFLTFVRQEEVIFLGLQQAQVVALLVFLGSLGVMVYLVRRPKPQPRRALRTARGR